MTQEGDSVPTHNAIGSLHIQRWNLIPVVVNEVHVWVLQPQFEPRRKELKAMTIAVTRREGVSLHYDIKLSTVLGTQHLHTTQHKR